MSAPTENLRKIPEQFGKGPFIELISGGNAPTAEMKNWTKHPEKLLTLTEAMEALISGKNLGFPTSEDLLIIDFDQHEGPTAFYEDARKNIPETFRVKSKTGKHAYYFPDEPLKNVLKSSSLVLGCDGVMCGDVFNLAGRYMVIPPTIRDGIKYEVENDVPIAHVKTREILKFLEPYICEGKKIKAEREKIERKRKRFSVVIQRLRTSDSGFREVEGGYRCTCPVHGQPLEAPRDAPQPARSASQPGGYFAAR